ncbi:acyl transferase/acyl hydrolase/lysophospholipase, partial [Flagelloscypha sp. PMI_526]
DGGGLLALSELYMLQETMQRLQSALDLETVPLPCDHFDVIGGSGSGGLIAILIGRLHLTVDQAIESFLELHRPLYDQNHSTTTRSDSFKRSVQTLVQTFIPNRDANTVMMENDPKCKVFVCTMPSASMGGRPECFRNYRARKFRSHDCHIWEAARATTAYRMLFEPIRIGPRLARETYVDPSLGHNNPIEFVVEETKALFNDPNDKFLFLSLGAGHPGILPSPPTEDGWAHFFKRLARDCEQTANRMDKDPGSGHARFNVSQGLQGISIEEFIDPGLIASHTKQYL